MNAEVTNPGCLVKWGARLLSIDDRVLTFSSVLEKVELELVKG